MNQIMYARLLALCIGLSPLVSHAADATCDDPRSNDEIAQCVGQDLREADAQINRSYKELISKLDDGGKESLRTAQRAWLKERDAICRLDNKESNREKWFQALLRDYSKTVCVTRYSNRRTQELQAMLATVAAPGGNAPKPAVPAQPAPAPESDIAWDKQPATRHSNGKWYFEQTLNYAQIVGIEPTVITLGVWSKTIQSGVLINVRKRDADKGSVRYGFAIDLDNGKFYQSKNGEWIDGRPGSNQGMNIKPGDAHAAAVQTSAEWVAPYLKARAIVPNYGGSPMTYAMPEGYSPWQN